MYVNRKKSDFLVQTTNLPAFKPQVTSTSSQIFNDCLTNKNICVYTKYAEDANDLATKNKPQSSKISLEITESRVEPKQTEVHSLLNIPD